MDYLVFGVGFGSTLVLLGWVLRQFGPAMRYRDTPDEVLGAEQLLERNDWQRFCIAIGALLSVCGAVMLLVTLITLLIRPADRTGTIIVGSIFVLSLLAVAAWIVLYVNQHRALAGDRRAEAVAATRGRTAPTPRPGATMGSAAPTATVAQPQATQPQAAQAATVSPEERPKEPQRRRETPPQRQPDQGVEAPRGSSPAAAERPSQTAPRPDAGMPSDALEQAAASAPIAAPEPAAATTTTPAADPAQALRNLHFKRSGSSRREESTAQERNAAAQVPLDAPGTTSQSTDLPKAGDTTGTVESSR